MAIIEWIRFFVVVAFLVMGMSIFFLEIFGVYRFHYVLNRMQIAATGDTLGIGLCLVGLMVANGLNAVTAKLALVVVFLWCASPVSSHAIARLQMTTDKRILDHCRIMILRKKKRKKEDKGGGADDRI
ncbi:sodium:proton antiporter [Lachnospiraceae bacterium]|mgnify:CR=1 FL=1|nr:sodium:proton antiporter [Lachnospiraceae bacterium]